jgi:flagella basal body P-ring formation protein FlgA
MVARMNLRAGTHCAGIVLGLALGLLPAVVPSAAAQAAAPELAVPVAARDLARGVVLTAEDVEFRAVGGTAPARAAGEQPGAGWVTRRVVRAGEPLREPAVARPAVIESGQTVEAIWDDAGVVLRVRGTAVGAAALGERVIVKVDAKRRLEGVASGPGLVRISRGT